jgi:UDP-N-acetylmuramyl pentapeptide phosphotransferase/UDP-N-acetylglucosamine-1-phosphate transferase
VAAVFVIEVVSVIAQLASYRLRGKRLLRCAPLHHHFQFGGVAETTIVRRFWLVAASSAGAGFIGLTMVGSNEVAPARSAKTPAATVRAVASTFQKLNL